MPAWATRETQERCSAGSRRNQASSSSIRATLRVASAPEDCSMRRIVLSPGVILTRASLEARVDWCGPLRALACAVESSGAALHLPATNTVGSVATDSNLSWDVRRAADRARTQTDWLSSAHSFSYGHAYDPDNTHFGLLIAHNEDVLAPGSGFDSHPHRDLEILTWVLAGELTHRDAEEHGSGAPTRLAGPPQQVRPGVAQRLSAGAGVRHSERNDSARPAHYVQMWIMPARSDEPPDYQRHDVVAELACGGLVTVASGLARDRGLGALPLNQPAAALHVARLRGGDRVVLPEAPFLHVFAASGAVAISDAGDHTELSPGDALRLSNRTRVSIQASEPAEVLVWEMHDELA